MNRTCTIHDMIMKQITLLLLLFHLLPHLEVTVALSSNTPKQEEQEDKKIYTLPLLHPHHIIKRRHLESQGKDKNDDELNLPPWGTLYQGYGTHYVDLYVGTPPQRQTLIIDTGSDITAFPCEECRSNCGDGYHTDGAFQQSRSATFKKVICENCELGKCSILPPHSGEYGCKVGISYAEGSSWNAFEATDAVYIGGLHDEPLQLRQRRRLEQNNEEQKDEKKDEGDKGEEEEEENNEEQKDEEKDEGDADDNTLATDKDKEASDEKVIDTTHIAHNTADLEAVFKAAALELEEEYKQSHNKDANDYTFELSFGCQYKITGLFKTQLADGIMGMENSENSFWMQMYNANMIQNKMFSLCFSNSNEQISKDGTVAGTVSLGGSDTRLHQTPMVYAENDTSNGWYTVYVKGIYLQLKKNKDVDDGKEVKVAEIKQNYSEIYDTVKLDLDIPKLNSRGIILDSGTTHTYLPWFVNKLFSDAFEKIYGATFDQMSKNITQLIFDIQEGDSDDEFDIDEELPTIVIQFRGATNVTEYDIDDEHQWGLAGHLDDTSPYDTILEIPPTQYLTFSKYKHTIVPKVHLDDTEGFGVIGANSMVGYDVLFDMDNNRVGFAKSDCNPDDLA